MEAKQNQVEQVILNCNPSDDGTTFVSNFTVPLHLSFLPDGVIIRQVCYAPRLFDGGAPIIQEDKTNVIYPVNEVIYSCRTSFINRPLCMFTANTTSSTPQTYFNLNRQQIDGDIQFQIISYPANVPAGTLGLTLEFVRY